MQYVVQTGDVVLLAPAAGRANLFQRGIQLMGSISTHNELVYVDPDGVPFVGCAHRPFFELIPLGERLSDCRTGRSNMLIARWREWPLVDCDDARYGAWQAEVAAMIRLLAALRVPYDGSAIISIARNLLRRWLGAAGQILQHREHHVYCTENVELILRLAGTRMFAGIAEQAFYAPIHVERVLAAGDLFPVADFGLLARLHAAWGVNRRACRPTE